MFDNKGYNWIAFLTVLALIMSPAICSARDNRLTGGASIALDYDNRSSDSGNTSAGDDDYQRLVFTPLLAFSSLSERDSFELSAEPSIRYDLNDSNTDWDSNLSAAFKRFLVKSWQMGVSDNFLRSDYNTTTNEILNNPAEPLPEDIQSTTPQLSSDRGRRRYWRNSLGLFSNYYYKEGSLFRVDFNYVALRNDDTSVGGDDDYDRYTTGMKNEHRFNAVWSSNLDLSFVRGIFKPTNSGTGNLSTQDQLSDDLKEYRFLFGLNNESIDHNPLSLSYNYIGTRFDETLQDDSDIHQIRVNWRRDISSRLYTNIGAGPSYEKIEGRDANWSGNGSAEINYSIEHGFFNFLVEKGHDVDNFSGSDERGAVDFWETHFSSSYQLLKDLTLSGRLSYLYEDREELQATPGNVNVMQLTDVHRDRYSAGAILSYTFWRYYNASVDYTYIKQESERVGDDYDDHRILLTLSWQKEFLRW